MATFFKIGLCALVLAGAAACSSTGEHLPYYHELPELPDAEFVYYLRNGDRLEVKVASGESYRHEVWIGEDGYVDLPHAGAIPAGGMTRADLRDTIRARLIAAGQYSNPQVSINVIETQQPTVAVLGAVRLGKRVTWNRNMTVYDALAETEGLTEDIAFARPVLVVRNAATNPVVFRVNLKEALELGRPVPRLLPGDVVVAQSSAYADVERVLLSANRAAITLTQPAIASGRWIPD